MKIILDCHRDYLFVVRLLHSSTHEPRKVNSILDSIDDSTINPTLAMGKLSLLFTLKEIKELKKKTGELLNFSDEINNKQLFGLMSNYFIFANGILHLRK
jgi:hypothetical protein